QLINQIDFAIQRTAPSSISSPTADISIVKFQPANGPFGRHKAVTTDDLATFLQEKFALENVNAACHWLPGKGAVIFVVKSMSSDKVVDGIYRQLKWSAESQFSKHRPAMLCVQLRDFSAPQLRKLAGASP